MIPPCQLHSFLIVPWCPIIWRTQYLFKHNVIDGHLGHFQFFLKANSILVSTILDQICVSLWDRFIKVELLISVKSHWIPTKIYNMCPFPKISVIFPLLKLI